MSASPADTSTRGPDELPSQLPDLDYLHHIPSVRECDDLNLQWDKAKGEIPTVMDKHPFSDSLDDINHFLGRFKTISSMGTLNQYEVDMLHKLLKVPQKKLLCFIGLRWVNNLLYAVFHVQHENKFTVFDYHDQTVFKLPFN